MIDREKTIKEMGYDPDKLKLKSSKKVWAVCDVCGKGRWNYLFSYKKMCGSCSAKGRKSWNEGNTSKITLICKECGKEFKVFPSKKNRQFCSIKCRGKYKRGKNSSRYKERIVLICKQCNKEFKVKPHNKNQLFCSQECDKKYKETDKTILICKQCNKEFEVKGNRKNTAICCSRKCMYKYNCGKNNPNYKRIILICKICGEEFKVKPYEKNRKCCSKKCWYKYNTKTNNINYKKPINLKCEYCKKTYQYKKHINGKRFCSLECSGKWHNGKNSPSWQGGISFEPYCPKFNESLKETIRNNYYRKCALCGKLETTKKHSVHHIDYDKSQGCNGQDILMVPLCTSCHGKTSGKAYRQYYETLLTKIERTRIMIVEYESKIDYRSI